MDIATAIGGIGALASTIGAQKRADRAQDRQHGYNKEIMEIQNKYLQENNRQNQALQFDMWNKTNAEAQLKHYKNAGLNVGLMYEGSGAGGATTGSVTGGAPSGGGNYSDLGITSSAMDIQSKIGQQLANIELTKAQTENVKTDTEQKEVNTELATWEIKDIAQGIKNKEAQQTATEIDNQIKRVEYKIKDQTAENTIKIIGGQAEQIGIELNILKREDNFDAETYETRKKQVFENLSYTIAQKAGIQANTELTKKVKEYYDKYYQIAKQNADTNSRNAATNEKNAQTNQYNSATQREAVKNNYRGTLTNEYGIFENAEIQEKRTQLQSELQTHQMTHDNINLLLDAPVKIFNGLNVWK